ncbi:MAG: SpoIIE family protein phosphatase [Bacteroidetes bacterium]|nr:SpoIIE family protein phosphatase [Bacteroidota bacterium]
MPLSNNPVFSRILFSLSCLTVCYPIILPEISRAQSYFFKNYSLSDGLAGEQVLCIYQDSESNLWIGTNGGGVSKFNGNTFINQNFNTGLPGNSVFAILEDPERRIWFGTDNGLGLYNGRQVIIYSEKDGLISNSVNCLYADRQGNIWVGTKGGVTEIIRKQKQNNAPLFRNFTTDDGLISNNVRSIIQDSSGYMWFGTEKGLTQLFEKKGAEWGNLVKYFTVSDGLTTNNINGLYLDRKNNLIVTTFSGGILSYYPGEREKGKKSFVPFIDHPIINSKTIWAFLDDRKGNYWIGIWDIGLLKVVRDENGTIIPQPEIITTYHGLINNKIFSLFEDREKNIWIGTYGGGVTRFSGKRFEVFTKIHGLADNFIWAVLQTANGDIWSGCDAGGVSVIHTNSMTRQREIKNYTTREGLSNNRVFTLVTDKDDRVWVGTDDGLTCIHVTEAGSPGIFTRFTVKEGLQNDRVRSLHVDKKGNLWIGYYGGGVDRASIYSNGRGPLRLKTTPIDNYLLKNFMVYHIYEDDGGDIWFATGGGGLLKLDPRNLDAESPAFASYTVREGLASDDVRMIAPDAFGNLWFATGNGISMITFNEFFPGETTGITSGTDNPFENFTMKDGLSSNRTYSLIFDSDSNLWIGTNIGTDRFDFRHYIHTKEKIFKHYGYMDGFTGIETNTAAACKDKADNLWFGTIGGLTKYNPSEDKNFAGESPVKITDMSVFLEYVDMEPGIELAYRDNNITFDYIVINLTAPEKVRYQYQLEGFDRQWSPVTTETYVNYSYLPPGDYIFKVKARNSEGIWNREPATFSFRIIPPLWQRVWFYVLCILILAGGIYILIRLRLRNLKKIARMLQQQVAERTKELSTEKEKVEMQNILIEKKNKDIISSIRYAGRIQEAVFHSREKFLQLLPGAFIFYRPKDIVSGDFFWFSQQNGKILFAAADCTGHGVPGALMSLIGNNLLDDIVIHRGITNPPEILDELHSGIIFSLRKHEVESETLEGMEIALCALDLRSKELKFSSAERPLVLVRNGQAQLFKGGRFPIGLLLSGERHYPLITLQLQPNDSFYIFTDGFCDQFGGITGKKFMFSRLVKLLTDINYEKVSDLESTLSRTIDDWKTGWAQIDDMLVIGVKV